MKSIILWVKQNRFEVVIIILIISVAAFLRFYRLSEYMTFLGDEGRDMLMMNRILIEHDFPLIGPPSSVGNIYLGPLYYYMMAIPMALFWLNPVAAAVMVALIGIATVGLIYFLAREWFGKWSALLSAFLYAISFVTVTYSRSSWNPNPAPFFSLLSFLGLHQARKSKNFLWFILTGASLSAVIQMHYLALILLPIFGILWLIELIERKKMEYKNFFLGTICAIIAFIFIISPLIIFDFKYSFMNFNALKSLFVGDDGSLGINVSTIPSQISSIYSDKLIGRYIGGENNAIIFIISFLILIPVLALIVMLFKKRKLEWPFLTCGVWLITGVLGLTFYKYSIYDHYLGFINPVPFLLLAALISLLTKKWQWLAVVIILIPLIVVNIPKSWLFTPPVNQLQRTEQVAKYIINKANGQPFNFALIAERNYDSAYQFYLDMYGFKPKVVPIEITNQLFVVCEDTICNPVGHPKYEIAGFGMSKIDTMNIVDGLKIYRLVANPSGQPPNDFSFSIIK